MKHTYFTDIEQVVQWTYDNKNLFYDKNDPWTRTEETLWPTSRADTIRKMSNYPSNEILDKGSFEQINIAELIMCINNAKDDTRHTDNREFLAMTSTSKKVMMILLLGRILDGEDEDGSFVVLRRKATEQYRDTHQVLYKYFNKKYKLEERSNKGIKTIKYLPGRTVSLAQICNASQKFKNGITNAGVEGGLKDLVKYKLVKCVDPSDKLYKLDFVECKKFLEQCRGQQRTVENVP